MAEEEQEADLRWRIWVAAILTALGAFYYLVFLAYFSRGVPIEKIHVVMTDSWPDILAEYIPLIAPTFLCVGVLLWYIHTLTKKRKIVAVPEPEYNFEFKTVDKSDDTPQKPDVDYVFKSRQNLNTPD